MRLLFALLLGFSAPAFSEDEFGEICGAPSMPFDPASIKSAAGLRFELPAVSVLNSYKCQLGESSLRLRSYAELGFPPEFTKKVLRDSVQRFADELHGKAFRLLGDPDDWFHGHFLHIDGKLAGLIYHTQEHEWPPYRFDEPNRKWLQWFDPAKGVVNAWDYEDGTTWIGPGQASGQFTFLRVACASVPQGLSQDSNLIEIFLAGERYCMILGREL